MAQTPLDRKRPLMTKFPSIANAIRRQTQRLRREGVNCTTVTSKHPLFSQSLGSCYGWVGGCCIKRESRSEDVAADKVIE
jgi:hypothetical protein